MCFFFFFFLTPHYTVIETYICESDLQKPVNNWLQTWEGGSVTKVWILLAYSVFPEFFQV